MALLNKRSLLRTSMKRSSPPYDAAIWFAIITGTIAVVAHLARS